jgi:type IV fimbrial biogenesis protein FimT
LAVAIRQLCTKGTCATAKMLPMKAPKPSYSGFSLFELMIATAVIGITAAVAVPTFQEYGRGTRAVATQNDFVGALNLARSEAVKRSTVVSVCATTNYNSCSAAANWAAGWMVFVDGTGTTGQLDGTDVRLQSYTGPGAGNNQVAFEFSGSLNTSPSFVSFTATGTVTPATAKWMSVRRYGCPSGTADQRRVIDINAVGHVRTRRFACT